MCLEIGQLLGEKREPVGGHESEKGTFAWNALGLIRSASRRSRGCGRTFFMITSYAEIRSVATNNSVLESAS